MFHINFSVSPIRDQQWKLSEEAEQPSSAPSHQGEQGGRQGAVRHLGHQGRGLQPGGEPAEDREQLHDCREQQTPQDRGGRRWRVGDIEKWHCEVGTSEN